MNILFGNSHIYSKFLQFAVAGIIVLFLPGLVLAKGEIYSDHGEWSFSLLIGGHSPKLTSLYDGLYQAPLLGSGNIGDQTDNNAGQDGDDSSSVITEYFRFDNTLPATTSGGKAGFELQWHANKKHSLIFGLGSWEKTSIAFQSGDMPTRGELNHVVFERRAKISYSEYSLGWHYTFFRRPTFQIYLRSSFHEVFDIDYREDFIFNYISGSGLAGFRRIYIMEAQTASLFMGQLGIGAEKFFSKWFSIGVDVGYLKGERSVQLRDQRIKQDFVNRGDPDFTTPYGVLSDGNVGYLAPDSTVDSTKYNRMKLNFNGWQIMLRMNIYY